MSATKSMSSTGNRPIPQQISTGKKFLAKETDREQIITGTKVLPFANTSWRAVALLEKSKQLTVTNMMKPVQHKKPTGVANNKGKPAPVSSPVVSCIPKGDKKAQFLPMKAAQN